MPTIIVLDLASPVGHHVSQIENGIKRFVEQVHKIHPLEHICLASSSVVIVPFTLDSARLEKEL